jgi:RimJ/RimL family protein N-acetyltransferase
MVLSGRPLEGELTVLDPLAEHNVDGIVACALRAPTETWKYTPQRVTDRADALALAEMGLERRRSGAAVPYVTRLRTTGAIVGSTTIFAVDPGNRRFEIGATWLLPESRGTAVNTEAKLLQLSHCFEDLGAMRVELKTDVLNATSRAAIRSLGATEEGTFRRHTLCWGGRVRDTVYYSIVDTEWVSVRERLSARLAAKRGMATSL